MPAASDECRAAGRSIGPRYSIGRYAADGNAARAEGLGFGQAVSRCGGSGVRNIVRGNEVIATDQNTQILLACGSTFSKVKFAEERFFDVDRAEHVDTP